MVPDEEAHGAFTVVEVLAAFFILAMFLTTALAGSASAVAAYRLAAQKRAALVLAQNRLEAIGVIDAVGGTPSSSRGVDGGSLLWSVQLDPVPNHKSPYRGVWVTVAVFPVSGFGYDAQHLIRLRSLKLVKASGHE